MEEKRHGDWKSHIIFSVTVRCQNCRREASAKIDVVKAHEGISGSEDEGEQ